MTAGSPRRLHDAERVRGQNRAGQHPADRRSVDAAQVDAHHPDRVPPRRGGAGQPVRGVIGGAALHLPQQPLPAVQVDEAGVPLVREQRVLAGLLIDGEADPAAAVLVDAQVRHRDGRVFHSTSARAANASCATGQEIPACRAASAGVIPRPVTSRAACSRSRAVIRHRGGRAGTDPVNVLRGHCWLSHLRRTLTQRRFTTSPARRTSRGRVTTVSCTRSETVPHSGQAATSAHAVTTHTSMPPSGAASTPVTCRPSTPNSADAVSSNTMPAAFC